MWTQAKHVAQLSGLNTALNGMKTQKQGGLMLCLKLLVVQEGSRAWRSVHSCCFEPKTRALRRKARTVRQNSIIKLHEETWKMGNIQEDQRFDKRPTTQCEENGENGCSQPPRTSTIKPCELPSNIYEFATNTYHAVTPTGHWRATVMRLKAQYGGRRIP